ncbi:MAG TPA: radical SAM protein [Acidobacteriota bacterium]|nr:radical SAM protein [Acidobacteriota bacterium]
MPPTRRIFSVMHRLQLLVGYLRHSCVCPGLPPTAIIATTHRCNMTCRMCLRSVSAFDGPNMEFGLFRMIIDAWSPYLRYLSLDGPGETTMNPDAFQMIRYARSRGIRVMFSTNAALMDEAMAEAILDSGVDLIIFSVNGVTPEVYRTVHGRPCYAKTVENIRAFLARKLRRRAPVLVSLQMVRLPETLPQVKAFYRQWRGVPGVDFVRVKKDVVCIKGACIEDDRRRSARRNPCSRLWHGPLFVETNGDVYASPGILYKAQPVGNVIETPLMEIWNNERMQSMRRAHLRGDITAFPECVDCAYPRPRLPLILAGFVLEPFSVGKLVPLAEKLAFWHRLPLFENAGRRSAANPHETGDGTA